MAGKKPNWNAIKAEYLKGGIGYRGLAKKFGVSETTLARRAGKESWASSRQQVDDKVEAILPGKIAEVIADEHAAISKDHYEGWELFKRAAKNVLPLLEDPTKIKDAAAVYRMATEGQRLAKGMDKKDKEEKPTEEKESAILLPADSEDWKSLASQKKAEHG